MSDHSKRQEHHTANQRVMEPSEERKASTAYSEVDKVTIDVLIVTFNNATCIRPLLDSLAAQTGVNLKIFIQDNGSSDGTVSAVERATDGPNCDLETSIVIDDSNPGFASAVNTLISASGSEFILILNPDTCAAPGTCSRLLLDLCEVANGEQVGLVSPRLQRPGGGLDRACMRREPTLIRGAATLLASRSARLRWLAERGYNYPSEWQGRHMAVDAINGAFMLTRRSKALAVGPMDERFWMYGEDLDWCRRFREHGLTNMYCGEHEWLHEKGGSERGVRGAATSASFARAMRLYYAKHHPDWHQAPGRAATSLMSRLV